jgi:hypothetical protein
MPIPIQMDHQMVLISQALDWDLIQAIGEIHREKKNKSNQGRSPHFRALSGAIVVKILKACDYRSVEDYIRNYLPARYLCDLQNSQWTPDHNTIWNYEVMLGEAGLQEINDYVLKTVVDLGFANPTGLCADTTAQEALIPHPTEVGHMGSFMKSMKKSLKTIVSKTKEVTKKVFVKMKTKFSSIAEIIREHRLFAKTKEARLKLTEDLYSNTQGLILDLEKLISNVDQEKLTGNAKKSFFRLVDLYNNMCRMMPEINLWIEKGKVVKGKIVSLFNPDFKAINRGKIGKQIEFGLKWGINQVRGGYISLFMHSNMMSYDADYAVRSVEEHIRIFGIAPRDFGFDRAAWSTEHMDEIKKAGVKNIGIAPKGQAKWKVGPRVQDRMIRERAQVEGKIGTLKTHCGFNKTNSKTPSGVRRSALRAVLCFNLKKFAKDLSATTFCPKQKINYAN